MAGAPVVPLDHVPCPLPAAAAQMTPQELSNSVRVAPRLQETVPEVLEVLPVMLEQLKTFPCFRGSLEKKVGSERIWMHLDTMSWCRCFPKRCF